MDKLATKNGEGGIMEAMISVEQKGKIINVTINGDTESKVCNSKKEADELYQRLCKAFAKQIKELEQQKVGSV